MGMIFRNLTMIRRLWERRCEVVMKFTLWQFNSLLLKMAIEIVDLPINSMVDLFIVMWLFTRG